MSSGAAQEHSILGTAETRQPRVLEEALQVTLAWVGLHKSRVGRAGGGSNKLPGEHKAPDLRLQYGGCWLTHPSGGFPWLN